MRRLNYCGGSGEAWEEIGRGRRYIEDRGGLRCDGRNECKERLKGSERFRRDGKY